MSADIIMCYAPQRRTVIDFLHHIGAVVDSRSPRGVEDPAEIAGLEHINFFIIRNHPRIIPQRLWDELHVRGAIIIEVDDTHARSRARLLVRGGDECST